MDIPWQLCRTIGPLLRDSSWQVLKHSQGGDFFCQTGTELVLICRTESTVLLVPKVRL